MMNKDEIISYLSTYNGYQGYYDYFEAKSFSKNDEELFGKNVVKMHYRGRLSKFVYSEEKSTPSRLVFYCNGLAEIDIPSVGLNNEEEIKNSVYQEIQKRTPEDILKQIKSHFRLFDKIEIEEEIILLPSWRRKILIDDDW